MGRRVGYGYRYRFLMVHEDEINSRFKSIMEPGRKVFLFEFRTKFILQSRIDEVAADPILDSETFDAYAHAYAEEDKRTTEFVLLYFMTYYRLLEYWMSFQEMRLLVNEALAFANHKAAEPEHASLNLVPIVVHLDVCTVQQEGESIGAALDRAIRAQNLVPLYLWPQPTAVKHKPLSPLLLNFLKDLDRIRVEDVDQGLALMPACGICRRKPNMGAQISLLPCNHAFHSHCIVQWLEGTDLCPLCDIRAYPPYVADPPSFIPRG